MVTAKSTNSTLKMDQLQIESYCRKFLMDNYNIELDIPVLINSRLSRRLGQFVSSLNTTTGVSKALRIEFSKKYLENGRLEDIISTIKHECIHYALYSLNKPYKDGEPLFESELRKHGSHSTGTTRLQLERNVNVYKCSCQEHVTLKALKNNGAYHTCKVCSSYLKYLGKRKQLV